MNGSNVPQVYYESGGWLVTSPNGCNPNATTCTGGITPVNLGQLEIVLPNGVAFVYGDWVTTTASIATPLPATWTMMLIGFVGFGFLAYRGKKNTATALAA